MKKWLGIVFVSLLLVTGCSQTETKEVTPKTEQKQSNNEQIKTEEKVEQKVTITLTKDKGTEEITSKEVVFEEGQNLMEVMQKNFEVETAYEGSFITSIDGIVANENEKYAWMFDVNGEPALKGAKDIILKEGDVVGFDLQKWE